MQARRWIRVVAAAVAVLGTTGVSLAVAGDAGAATVPLYAYANGTGNGSGCPVKTPSTQVNGCSLSHALAQATKQFATVRTVYLATAGVNPTTPGDPTHYVGNWTVDLTYSTSGGPVIVEPAPGLATEPVLDGDGGTTGSACSGPATSPPCTGSILSVSTAGYLDLQGFTMANADNTLTGDGGAIDNGDAVSGAHVSVSQMTFTHDTATDGGAIDNGDNSAGGGTLDVTSSIFTSDAATTDGGAIDNADNGGSGTVSVGGTSTFSGDTSASDGGAIDSGDSLGTSALLVGGATFSSDSAVDDGGAIDNADSGGTSTAFLVSGSTFSQDSATQGDGGAIDSADSGGIGSLTVTGGSFTGDTATSDGGAIDNADSGGSGTLTDTGSTFSTDSASTDGGAVDSGDNGDPTTPGPLVVTGAQFTSDTATFDGGAIAAAGNLGAGNATVSTSTFTSDSSQSNGGAIDYADSGGTGKLTVTGSTFTSDTATADGGAVDNADGAGSTSALTVTSSGFTSDGAGVDGGAIDNADNSGAASGSSVAGSSFSLDTTTAGDGGAFDNADTDGTATGVSVTGSTFSQDSAGQGDGGAIDNADSGGTGAVTVGTSTFSDNTATLQGGAIDNADYAPATAPFGSGTLVVDSSTFSGNTATASGPAIANVAVGSTGVGTVTVAADQIADACNQGTGTWHDAGYVVGDATCQNGGTGDVATPTLAADLGPLADNGGPTETLLPLPGNPGAAIIPNPTSVTLGTVKTTLCPTTDQRGTASASGATCYSGSVQGTPQRVVFTSAPLAVAASSSATNAITLAVVDTSGDVMPAPVATTIHLASSGSGGVFSLTSGGPATTSVVLPQSATSVTVYFGDRTAGTPTLTASANGYGTSTQTASVAPGAATTFTVAAPATATVNAAVTVTVTAKDALGNTATGYAGAVRFTASGGPATLPANYTFTAGDHGTHKFPVTFTAVGSVKVTATDTVTPSVTGSSAGTVVSPVVIPHGYWLVGADGGIFTFGSAQFHGSTGNLVLQRPVVGITPTKDRAGYWLVATDGGLFAFGDAGYHGSIPGLGIAPAGTPGAAQSLNAPIVGMVPSTDGQGYFMVAADGGVFAFGDARYEGSCPGIGGCSGSAVAVVPDATGNGYWLVTATGNVYAFGDAPNLGSPGSQGSVVTSAVRTPTGKGYWILFANGTVTISGMPLFSARPWARWADPIRPTPSSPRLRVTATGWPPPTGRSSITETPPTTEGCRAAPSTHRSSPPPAGEPFPSAVTVDGNGAPVPSGDGRLRCDISYHGSSRRPPSMPEARIGVDERWFRAWPAAGARARPHVHVDRAVLRPDLRGGDPHLQRRRGTHPPGLRRHLDRAGLRRVVVGVVHHHRLRQPLPHDRSPAPAPAAAPDADHRADGHGGPRLGHR